MCRGNALSGNEKKRKDKRGRRKKRNKGEKWRNGVDIPSYGTAADSEADGERGEVVGFPAAPVSISHGQQSGFPCCSYSHVVELK